MRAFDKVSSRDFLVCPICEVGSLGTFDGNSTRCDSCGCLLNMAVPETLREIVHLPDAWGGTPASAGIPRCVSFPVGSTAAPPAARRSFPWRDPPRRVGERRKDAGPAYDGRSAARVDDP